MNTFVFVAGPGINQHKLEGWKAALKDCLPYLDQQIDEGTIHMPEESCGWFWLQQNIPDHPPLITSAMTDRFIVISYGDPLSHNSLPAAQAILDEWQQGGAGAVGELNGNFGAVIMDRRERVIHLASDLIGHRALRYWHGDGAFATSPHDLALFSTGLIPADFDYQQAAALIVNGWSWEGKSLLRHISNGRGGDSIRWDGEQLQHRPAQMIDPLKRIESNDKRAIKRNFEHLIDEARDNVRAVVKSAPVIHTELTAGEDSRAVLSLLLTETRPEQIVAITDGKQESLDASVARQIARMYGVRHLILETETRYAELEDFRQGVEGYAFAMNANANAMYSATGRRKIEAAAGRVTCTGAGSEVFRGAYTYDPILTSRPPQTAMEAVPPLSRSRLVSQLPWSAAEYSEAIRARAASCIEGVASETEGGYDLLDLYYLRERYAVWGGLVSRSYSARKRFAPLISSRLVRAAYRMPTPMRAHSAYMRECIRRFTPRAYWVHVNGKKFLPLLNAGGIANALSKADRALYPYFMKVKNRLTGRQPATDETTPQQISAAAFRGPLFDYVHQVLTAEGSFAVEIFGRKGVDQLLEEHRSKVKNRLDVLGMSLTAEHYHNMVLKLARDKRVSSA